MKAPTSLLLLFSLLLVFCRPCGSAKSDHEPGNRNVKRRSSAARNPVRNELMEAVFIADVDRVRDLLSLDPQILSSRPPVLVDRMEEEEGRVSLMLCGLDPQHDNATQLDIDCANIARLLHSAGANMSHIDFNGWDALSMGSVRGFSRFCRYLIVEARVDIDRVDNNGVSALMKAAGHAHFDTFKVMVEHGADVALRDSEGRTALHYATQLALRNSSYIPFLKKVLTTLSPPQVNELVDMQNRSSLMYAVLEDNVAVTAALLEAGADPSLQDSFFVSAISMAKDTTVRKILLDAAVRRVEQQHAQWLQSHDLDKFFGEGP